MQSGCHLMRTLNLLISISWDTDKGHEQQPTQRVGTRGFSWRQAVTLATTLSLQVLKSITHHYAITIMANIYDV